MSRSTADLSPFFASVFALRSDPRRLSALVGARDIRDRLLRALLRFVAWMDSRRMSDG